MGLAAKISIAIDATTATLQKGFGEATAAINKLDQGMAGNVAKGMAMFTAGMAAVQGVIAGVQGAISSVMGGLADLTGLQNFATRTGIAAEQAQALSFAVGQFGVDQGEFLTVLEKLQMKISEAANGTGDAKLAFEELGLSAEVLNTLPLDQKFAMVAEAISHVGNEGDRTRLAMKLFEESGGKLVGLLSGGVDSLNAFGAEAEQLGLLTGGSAAAAAEASAAIAKMKAAWGGFVQQIGILVAPAIETIANALATVVGWMNQLFGAATGTDGTFAAFGTEAEKAGKVVTRAVRSSETAAKESSKAIKDTFDDIPKPEDSSKAIKAAFADVPKPADWKTEAIGAVTRGSAAGFSAVQEAQRAKQDADRRHKEMIQWLTKINDTTRESAVRVSTVGI